MGRLVKGLLWIDRRVAAVEVAGALAALLVMVGLFATDVTMRLVGEGGLPQTQGVVRHLVLWVTMLGASLCVRDRKHIAIEVIDRLVTPSGRRVVDGMVMASTALLCAWLASIAFDYVVFERAQYAKETVKEPLFAVLGTPVPPWWSLCVMPAGLALMSARYGLKWLERVFVDEPIDLEAVVREEIDAYEERRSSEEDPFGLGDGDAAGAADSGPGPGPAAAPGGLS